VSELPAGTAARLHRHGCEAIFYVLKGEGLHRDSQAEAEEVKDRLERRRLVCYASRSLAPALQRKQTLGGALSRDYYDSFDEIPGRMVYRKQI
jgi:hypothetical protein